MKITGASTADVLSRKKSWFYDEVFQRAEELTIEMREVVKEMSKQLPETFLGLNVFLPTLMTILSNHFGSTVQAVFFFTLREMGQL